MGIFDDAWRRFGPETAGWDGHLDELDVLFEAAPAAEHVAYGLDERGIPCVCAVALGCLVVATVDRVVVGQGEVKVTPVGPSVTVTQGDACVSYLAPSVGVEITAAIERGSGPDG